MADKRNDGEDVQVDEEEEVSALFHSYPIYYVQSPSNTSHAYSDAKTFNHESSFPYPIPHTSNDPANPTQDDSRFLLLRYSSSRASTNSFHQQIKNAASYELQVHGGAAGNDCERGDEDDHDGVDDNDEDYEVVDCNKDRSSNGGRKLVNDIVLVRPGSKRSGCWRFFSFSASSSSCWIAVQLFWRLMVSVGAALLVFYLATKPPPPKMFVKMAGVGQFVLGEGVDGSGVSSKILTCNCTISLTIDNNSKVFGLHIQPSEIELSFGPLIVASSREWLVRRRQ
ncbi:hypothetical protein Syun_001696 [Stephania yunnanensis]|uniref:Uncharacterized protein n=1 Tax=Stephania yunnanensis TaxID=152371 RepID=A0AAP0QB58_9MAGN